MAAERCPLCQSRLKNGECLSCGYRPPDEGDISALYNYDPTDYPQQGVREIMPDVQMEEIYPGRPEMPDIIVHDDQNNTVGRYGTGANKEAWQQVKQAQQAKQEQQEQQIQKAQQAREAWQQGQQGQQEQQAKQIIIPDEVAHLFDENGNFNPRKTHRTNNNQNPYANNRNFTPYQSPQNNSNPNPYANNGNFSPYQKPTGFNYSKPQYDINSYGEFIRKYWWALLFSVFVPFLGFIFFLTFQRKVDRRYATLFIVAFFIGRIIFGF